MKVNLILITLFVAPLYVVSQIRVIERSNSNVELIGKISHTLAYQTNGLNRKLPILDPLKVTGNLEVNKYKNLRKDANNLFKSVGLRKQEISGEDFSASLIHFQDEDIYLLTFQNSQYNYQNESFWISKETKLELHNFLIKEIEKKHKFKNFEIILDNNVVLVVSFNKKKISFNLWDGYTWIQSYWYRKFKVNNLFGG